MFSATKGGSPSGYQISRSVRLRSSASAYFNRTPASATNRRTFTWSGWVKRGASGDGTGSNHFFLFTAGTSTAFCAVDFYQNNIRLNFGNGTYLLVTSAVYRDYSSWYHIVVSVDTTQTTDTNRVKLYINGTQVTAFSTAIYPIQNYDTAYNNTVAQRIAFDGASNYFDGYLTEVNFIDGQALTPSSFGETNPVTGVWQPKKYAGTYGTNGFYLPFNWSSAAAYAGSFNGTSQYLTLASNAAFAPGTGDFTIEAMVNFNTTSGNRPIFQNDVIGTSGTDKFYLNYDGTNIVLGRHSTGTSSTAAWTPVAGRWYHIAAVRQSGTVKIFVDGTSLTVTNSTALNGISFGQGGAAIGALSTPIYLNGSISNLRYVVGTAVYTSSFTAPTSNLTAISGTQILTLQNSTIIDNSPNAATITNTGSVTTTLQYPYQYNGIGTDQSGNTNNWTPNNISTVVGTNYDSMLDVPTQWADGGNGRGNYAVLNPLAYEPNAGRFPNLSEANLKATNSANNVQTALGTFGISSGKFYCEFTVGSAGANNGNWIGVMSLALASGYSNARLYNAIGQYYNGSSWASYGATFTANDVLGIALDMDNQTLEFFKNGASQGQKTSIGLSGLTMTAAVSSITTGENMFANFGQRPFAYTPPSGFKALNTLNLPTPTILKGNQYFDVVLYTGNAVQDRAVTGFGFDLDLAWIKSRNNAGSHALVNREVGGDKQLFSNLTNAEQTNSDVTNGFTTGGILVGDNLTGTGSTNQNTYTYALWGWKEGATQGFDIVTYTGTGVTRTVAHNLGVAPSMIIAKNRSAVDGWYVAFAPLAGWTWSSDYLLLNGTGAKQTNGGGTVFPVAPTSSVFTVGGAATNASGNNFVAYLFAEIAGFSKFGSYTGNGSTDGPFVFCGFRPRFVMIKRTDAVSNWWIENTANIGYNTTASLLSPNTSDAEYGSASYFDLLSNGFKLRQDNTTGYANASGGTYIFAAFAELPFKNSLAR